MEKIIKVKNIILILNKLLIKSRNSSSSSNTNENLMNNLLFENKIIDLKNGVEKGIIEEISESIINN